MLCLLLAPYNVIIKLSDVATRRRTALSDNVAKVVTMLPGFPDNILTFSFRGRIKY